MSISRAVIAACMCGTVLLSAAYGNEPEKKRKVLTVEELLKRPQNYWSVGISFNDVVVRATGEKVKILDTLYYRVELKELGVAYATEESLQLIQEQGVNRDYLFTGTVLHSSNRRLFRNKDIYSVIIYTANANAISSSDDVVQGLEDLSLAEEGDHPATRHMLDLFSTTQRDMMSLAERHEVPLSELFDTNSEHNQEARDIVRKALRKLELAEDIPGNEILSGFIFHMLAKKFAAAQEDSMTEDSSMPEPEMDEESDGEKEAEIVDEASSQEASSEPELVEEPVIEEVPAPEPEIVIEAAPIIAVDRDDAADEVMKKSSVEDPVVKKKVKAKKPKKAKAKEKAKAKAKDKAKAEEKKKSKKPKKEKVKKEKAKKEKVAPKRAPIFALDQPVVVNNPDSKKSSKKKKRAKVEIKAPEPSPGDDIYAPMTK